MDNTKEKKYQKINVAFSQTAAPKLVEKTNQDWVDFLTTDGRFYPHLLQDLLYSSAIHGAVTKAKARMVAGKGLTYVKDGITVENQALIEKFIRECEELVPMIALDYQTYGAFCLEVLWSKGGNKIAQINHIDPMHIQSGKFNSDRKVDSFYYSEDWSKWRRPENTPERIAAFDVESKEKRQLLYKYVYSPGRKYYGTPDYVAARDWIELDGEIPMFHLNSIKTGFSPNVWVNFNNGVPTEEEQRKMFNDFNNSYTSAKGTKTFLTYSDGKDTAPEITPIQYNTSRDALFVTLNDQIIQNILSGHSVNSPMLFGYQQAGKLGGSNELEQSYKNFDRDVITPAQSLIEKTLNKLLEINGLRGRIKIDKQDPQELKLPDNVYEKIMTTNEMRKKIGLPDLTDEQIAELKGGATSDTQNKPVQ